MAFVDRDKVAGETGFGVKMEGKEGLVDQSGQVVGLGKGMAGKEYVCLGELGPEFV